MTKWTLRCVVLYGLLVGSASLHAHHSLAGMYSLGKEAKVTGAFKAFRLVNPHSSMKLDVKGQDGRSQSGRSSAAASGLARLGIGKTGPNALKPGDEITSRCCRRLTARVRLAFCRRSPTRTATWSVSARPTSRPRRGGV